MVRIVRIFIILVLGALVFLFGVQFGPDRHQRAEAKVFERLLLLTKDMPAYLFEDDAMSEPRRVMVNGNTTHMMVGRTGDYISSVLDFYARRYEAQPVQLLDKDAVEKIPDLETKDCVTRALRFVECLGASQQFRMERDDFGFWSGFDFHDADLAIGTEDFAGTLESALSSGKLGTLGIGRVVIALKERPHSETTVITMWTDRDFNINRLMSDGHGDVGGDDIKEVPRYPGNRRILTVQQENRGSLDSIAVYEGDGSLVANIIFYHAHMERARMAGRCDP